MKTSNKVIDRIPNLPEQKRALLYYLVDQLSRIPGLAAIVLGGSYAAGTQHEGSDLDLGLYYSEANPFSIADVQRIAQNVSIKAPATVTSFYEWGAWVNGGAWIHTQEGKVDFLYRNLDQVQRTIDEAQQGIIHHDYDQQPTYGFYSVIYLAETQICLPLFDLGKLISKLKTQVEIYPARLKRKMIDETLWSAEFALLHARPFAARGDIYNTVGCLTRILSNLTQALFALNDRYFMSDKKVLDTIAIFPKVPRGYIQQINHLLGCPGSTAPELIQTVSNLEQVWHSVVSLTGELYQPRFQV
ncbi:MAG TPA: nucleotidyltransferase domain-containing protein [Anaerolineales bacterium]|nr:nucleotidyltransferase domain-containing protein [Anaerolineales bacterium]